MSVQSQFDREESLLVEQYNSGQITREEFNAAMRELQRDYRASAEEAAMDAYQKEMGSW